MGRGRMEGIVGKEGGQRRERRTVGREGRPVVKQV